jgi:DNA-binding NarL/FixJ family response regulator
MGPVQAQRFFDAARVCHSILIIEDDEPTRERLGAAVALHPELHLVAATGTLSEGAALVRAHKPKVVLLDLGLPDGSGLDLIRLVSREKLPTEVMVVTVFGDESHVIAALSAGATGYLLKDGEAGYIGNAILQLLAGGSPISPSVARHLLRRFQPAPSPDRPSAADSGETRLTRRETEVLQLVAKGYSYTEIADTLGMSIHTLTSHVKHIYRKLAVRSRGEAVFEALQLGLIQIDRDLPAHLST